MIESMDLIYFLVVGVIEVASVMAEETLQGDYNVRQFL